MSAAFVAPAMARDLYTMLLTPGHFLKVSALVLPSGATQKITAGYQLDAVVGWIDITIAYDGSFSETVTHTLNLPTSELQYGGDGTDSGWAWSAMRRLGVSIAKPVGRECAHVRSAHP